ncbi:hypothetical protein CCH79_00007474 [Gambusia affinis]|uniref:Uncharacterized protein n=1 Tax=Gambusia affinis TaxID=33528 RepID=A0A315WE12_GAMAF|nr:hypothetical protein CCH79_00007474 [Gambusia affinis]
MEGPQPGKTPDNEYMAMDPDQWEDQDDTYENGDNLGIDKIRREVLPVPGGATQLTHRTSWQTNDTLNRPQINKLPLPSRYMTIRWPPPKGNIGSAKTEQLGVFESKFVRSSIAKQLMHMAVRQQEEEAELPEKEWVEVAVVTQSEPDCADMHLHSMLVVPSNLGVAACRNCETLQHGQIKEECSDLLSILLKEPQLETLVQFQLPHVPQLLQILPRPVELVQQRRHFSNQIVCVCVRVKTMMVVVGVSAGTNAAPLEQSSALRIKLLYRRLCSPLLQRSMLLHEPPSPLQVPWEIALGQGFLKLFEACQRSRCVTGKKVVWLDDEGNVDARRERFLQDLQQRFDAVPLGATHVHNDSEAMSGHLLTEEQIAK